MERRQWRQTGGAWEKRGGLLGGCLTTASVTERFAGTKFRLIAAEETKVAAGAGGSESPSGTDEEIRRRLKVWSERLAAPEACRTPFVPQQLDCCCFIQPMLFTRSPSISKRLSSHQNLQMAACGKVPQLLKWRRRATSVLPVTTRESKFAQRVIS